MRVSVTKISACLLTALLFVSTAWSQAAVDDAESYGDYYVGVNGGSGSLGWATGFALKRKGLSDGIAPLTSKDNIGAISGDQSFGLGALSLGSQAGGAVSRSFGGAISLTRTLSFKFKAAAGAPLQQSGVSLNETAASDQDAWDEGQRLFVGIIDGVWQANGTPVTKGGTSYAATDDTYEVSITFDPTTSGGLFQVVITNLDDAAQGTSDVLGGSLSGTLGAPIQSVSFAAIAMGETEGFIWDDMNLSDPMIPLPVELTSFEATRSGSAVTLSWATATETNNSGFEVERSVDSGTTFKRIAFVQGAGTSTEAQRYRFSDGELPYGVTSLAYRIKQIDFDGSFTYSSVVEVGLSAPAQFTLHGNYPNPFNPQTAIRYELPEAQHVTLDVFDALGRKVATLVDEQQEAGRKETTFEAFDLPSGAYFYRIQAGDFVQTRRMLLVR